VTIVKKHQIVATKTAHAGWARMLLASLRLPDGRVITREIEDHGAAVCVLPYHRQRRTAVLVRQFRTPVFFAAGEEETLEAIAGILEESVAAECARREAQEEAGLALDDIELLFTGWTMPGLSTERMNFFLATYSGTPRREHGGVADEHEDIAAIEIPLAELAAMADAGGLTDVKTLLLVQTLRLRQPHLFTP
jgi:nudix-type nucleoside diphosphatase (YffH/AdpP family)